MKTLLLSVLIISSLMFATISGGNLKIGVYYDFSSNSYGTFSELRMRLSSAGSDFSGSAFLKNENIEAFSFTFGNDFLSFGVYKGDKSFPNTDDHLLLYNFSSEAFGQDGFTFKIWNVKGVFLVSNDLQYIAGHFGPVKILVGDRKDERDYMVDFSMNTGSNIFGEVVYTTSESSDGIYYHAGIASSDWKFGLKYYGGNDPLLPRFTKIDPSFTNIVSGWYSAENITTWINLSLSNLVDESSVGLKIGNKTWIDLYKKGFSSVSIDPRKIGEFHISVGGTFGFLGFNGKFSYTFGKPAHNTVRTIGDVYYIEMGRSFGNLGVFFKLQYIVGYYERRFTAYGELKLSVRNGELKLTFGNGDFYNVNTLQRVLNLEANVWW